MAYPMDLGRPWPDGPAGVICYSAWVRVGYSRRSTYELDVFGMESPWK